MFTLKITSQFKKDLKRIQNKPDKIYILKRYFSCWRKRECCLKNTNRIN